jgi:pSer/pThr/pTyr-binding forkhead associated (FHA) protein
MSVKMKVVQGRPHGSYLDFPEGEFVVGRGPECHVRPNSELISRQHCLLLVSGRVLRVRDLGSTNGTLVNGKLVVEECALRHGDTLQLGPLVLEVVLTDEEAEVAPPTTEETGAFGTIETQTHPTMPTDRP